MIDVRSLLNGTKAPSTVDVYEASWALYLAFCGSEEEALKSENLVKWRQHMVNNTELSPNTINRRIRGIQSIVKSLAESKIVSRETRWDFSEVQALPKNALRDRLRENNRVRIEPKQMRRMVNKPKPDLYDPLLCMHRAILLVLGTTGMRISEAINIQLDDIDQVDGSYIIRNVMSKAKSEPRSVPLGEEAYEAIMDWIHIRPIQSSYVFIASNRTKCEDSDRILWADAPMTSSSARRVVKKYGRKIGMPHIKPHDLRRFVGTQLVKKSGLRTAQKVLGHASPDTTARYYVLDDTPTGVTDKLF